MTEEPLQVAKVDWCAPAALALAGAAGSVSDLEEIAAEVATGRAELWAIKDHGFLVTRAEIVPNCRPELVLVVGAGRGARRVIGAFRNVAAARRWSCRVHTRRPGLMRMLFNLDFDLAFVCPAGYNAFRWEP